MTNDERWDLMWQAYMDFIKEHRRCPSKYKPEERSLINWAKHNRKWRNKGLLPDNRKERFRELTELSEQFRRVNQHAYLQKKRPCDVEL